MGKTWFIRATTKDGKKFTTNLSKSKAIIIFKNLYEAAKISVKAVHTGLSETWEKEIFMEFMNPDGVIVLFELCEQRSDEKICVFNMFWFDVDAEGKRQLKYQHPVEIEYTLSGIIRSHGGMSAFHSGTDDEELDYGIKEHQMTHARVLKERDPGIIDIKTWDLSTDPDPGVDLAPKIPVVTDGSSKIFRPLEQKAADYLLKMKETLVPAIIADQKAEVSCIDLAPRTKYRIYIDRHPSHVIVDDIDFMDQIHKNSEKIIFDLEVLPGYWSMSHSLFEIIDRFLRHRDFKIGAHPVDEVLEERQDTTYKLSWDPTGEEIIYSHPSEKLIKAHEVMHTEILKSRHGEDEEAYPPVWTQHCIISESNVSKLTSRAIHHGPVKYRIYIDGRPSNMIVDDIDFMDRINKNSEKMIFDVRAIQDIMTQSLFETIDRFLHFRDFKIGAHPVDEPLEDGNDAGYSISWSHNQKMTIFLTPVANNVLYDDLNF